MESVRIYEYTMSKSKHFRVVGLKGLRPVGVDHSRRSELPNDQKYDAAVSRARRNLRDLLLCNKFEYFCTFTFDDNKIDRTDYKLVKRSLLKFFNNFRTRYAPHFRYVLVPEQHKNGAWHFHGALAGIPVSEFYVPDKITRRHPKTGRLLTVKNTKKYVRWRRYAEKFGHFDCSPIRSPEACAVYISKYLFKQDNGIDVCDHLYFCSNGLLRPELVEDVPNVPFPFDKPEYEDYFCKVSWSAGDGVIGVLLPDWYFEPCSELRSSDLSSVMHMTEDQLEKIVVQPLTFADLLAGV